MSFFTEGTREIQGCKNREMIKIFQCVLIFLNVVDGRYQPWTEWSECSVTCANGTQERTRECVGQAHGGTLVKDPRLRIERVFQRSVQVGYYFLQNILHF